MASLFVLGPVHLCQGELVCDRVSSFVSRRVCLCQGQFICVSLYVSR